MTTDLAAVAAQPQAARLRTIAESPDFDERWAAWQAKGAAHERAFRRKMAVVIPILVASAAALILYALVGR